MPGLVVYGRRWEFGSDDLVVPSLVVFLSRVAWLLLQVIGVAVFHETLSCNLQESFSAVAYLTLIMTAVLAVSEGAIMVISARGTILNSKPRRLIRVALHVRLALLALELVTLLVKTGLVSQSLNQEELMHCVSLDTAITVARIVVSITWFFMAGLLLAVVIYLDPCHLYSAKVDYIAVPDHEDTEESAQRMWRLTHTAWEKRFKVFCCFAGADEPHQVAYREVAQIFAHLFSDVDLVLSDIVAGMVLLQKEHLQQEVSLLQAPTQERSSQYVSVNFSDPHESLIFQESLHFLQFAIGIYSWPIYMYMNICCGSCGLVSHMTCCCCFKKQHSIPNDNACGCGYAGLVAATGIRGVDILYATLENDLYQVPFMVCLDHEKRSVVISVRGTLSLHDVLTDLTATSRHVHDMPGWPRFRVHKGMLSTANWLLQRIKDEDVLGKAFSKVPRYQLVCVGHSLGAGCATILSIMLQEQYPDIRCFCYSPTGSLLSADAAAYTQTFITSVTLGYDLVTRLSVPTAHCFKNDIMRAIHHCHKPKYRVLFEGFLETVSKLCGRTVVFHEEDPENTALLTATVSSNGCAQEDTEEDAPDAAMPLLYPPGRMIHIQDITMDEGSRTRRLEARWASSSSFSRITISPTMLSDHLPNMLLKAMQAVWDDKKALQLQQEVAI